MIGDLFTVEGKFNPLTGAVEAVTLGTMQEVGTGQLFLPPGITTTNPTGIQPPPENTLAVNYVQGVFMRADMDAAVILVPYGHFEPAPKKAKPAKSPYRYKIGSNIPVGAALQYDSHYDGSLNGFVNPSLGQAKVTGHGTQTIEGQKIEGFKVRRTEIDAEWFTKA